MENSKRLLPLFLVLAALLISPSPAGALEVSGDVGLEARHFYKSPVRSEQETYNLSLSAQPEFYHPLSNERDSITFTPFFRLDQNDSARTHGDIREFKWHKVRPMWELRVGIDRVFWGVTETRHLVNIINQVDLVENMDEEELLGQPMIDFTLVRDWGNLDFFLLPFFRERTYPDRDGRPSTRTIINNDKAVYESGAEEWHTDLALRWSHTFGPWDMGLSHFYGTSREPRFDPAIFILNSHGERELIPIYEIIHQTGLDVQATYDAWLLKLEAITRSGQGDRFFAAVSGFEYTFFDLVETGMDLGIVCEYLYDERDFKAMDNDLALGFRMAFNDTQSTEFLAVMTQDMDNRSRSFYVEAYRRMGNSCKLTLEVRGMANVSPQDPMAEVEADEYAQLTFAFFY